MVRQSHISDARKGEHQHADKPTTPTLRADEPTAPILPAAMEARALTDSPKSAPAIEYKEAQYHEMPIEPTLDRQMEPAWQPSLFRLGPLAGLAALILSFLLILCSYAILTASNGDLVMNWEYSPTVYLAIFVAVGNKAMAFATIQYVRTVSAPLRCVLT